MFFNLRKLIILLCGVFLVVGCKQQNVTNASSDIPKIIFDTDMGPDYDDVGAIAMLHALADQGECEILATVASCGHPTIAPTIELFNKYFKREQLPVGVPAEGAPNFTAKNNWNELTLDKFAPELKSHKYPSAVSVYRQVLAAQPDSSVTIVTVGFLSNISDLLDSEGDEYSPKNGIDLVNQKVKQWVVMAGEFPAGNEFNVNQDAAASVNAFTKWPKPILFSGFEIGVKIMTGNKVGARPNDDPVSYSYRHNLATYADAEMNNRNSWDQTAVLVAVRNPADYFYVNGPGKFVVNSDGSNTWDPTIDAGHYFLSHKYLYLHIANVIEELMLHVPQQ